MNDLGCEDESRTTSGLSGGQPFHTQYQRYEGEPSLYTISEI